MVIIVPATSPMPRWTTSRLRRRDQPRALPMLRGCSAIKRESLPSLVLRRWILRSLERVQCLAISGINPRIFSGAPGTITSPLFLLLVSFHSSPSPLLFSFLFSCSPFFFLPSFSVDTFVLKRQLSIQVQVLVVHTRQRAWKPRPRQSFHLVRLALDSK